MTLEIQIKVQPKSSRRFLEVTGPLSAKVYVTEPPADGQANEAVIELISKFLHVPKSSIAIVRGQTSRIKTLHITGNSIQFPPDNYKKLS